MQDKEWWNVEIKIIVSYNLSDGVRSISEWVKLAVGPSDELLLQMYLNFVYHLELMWHLMLIMTLFVLSIFSIQYVLDLLKNVLNGFNEASNCVSFELDMN